MNYNHNQCFGLFKFLSGDRKFYLNNSKGYSRKIISTQTDYNRQKPFNAFNQTWLKLSSVYDS